MCGGFLNVSFYINWSHVVKSSTLRNVLRMSKSHCQFNIFDPFRLKTQQFLKLTFLYFAFFFMLCSFPCDVWNFCYSHSKVSGVIFVACKKHMDRAHLRSSGERLQNALTSTCNLRVYTCDLFVIYASILTYSQVSRSVQQRFARTASIKACGLYRPFL